MQALTKEKTAVEQAKKTLTDFYRAELSRAEDAADFQSKELSSAREEIERSKAQVRRLELEESKTTRKIDVLQQELDELRTTLSLRQEEIADTERHLRDARSALHAERTTKSRFEGQAKECQRELRAAWETFQQQQSELQHTTDELRRCRNEVLEKDCELTRLKDQVHAKDSEMRSLKTQQEVLNHKASLLWRQNMTGQVGIEAGNSYGANASLTEIVPLPSRMNTGELLHLSNGDPCEQTSPAEFKSEVGIPGIAAVGSFPTKVLEDRQARHATETSPNPPGSADMIEVQDLRERLSDWADVLSRSAGEVQRLERSLLGAPLGSHRSTASAPGERRSGARSARQPQQQQQQQQLQQPQQEQQLQQRQRQRQQRLQQEDEDDDVMLDAGEDDREIGDLWHRRERRMAPREGSGGDSSSLSQGPPQRRVSHRERGRQSAHPELVEGAFCEDDSVHSDDYLARYPSSSRAAIDDHLELLRGWEGRGSLSARPSTRHRGV